MFAQGYDDKGNVTSVDFPSVFRVPLFAAIFAAVILLVLFHPPKKEDGSVPT
jgi:hypothetical protein